MKNSLDVLNLPLGDALPKLVFVQIVGDLAVHQIQELVALGQIVDCQNVGIAALIQPAHDIAADEARRYGYNNPDSSPRVPTDVPVGKEECGAKGWRDVEIGVVAVTLKKQKEKTQD